MPVMFVEIAFADNTLYFYSGVGSYVASGTPYTTTTFPYGTTFTGLGWLGKLSAIPQINKVQAQSVTLALSGIPSSLVLEAINQVRMTGTATIWLGFLNISTGALIADPAQVFAGALDVPTLEDSGETCTIAITAENPLVSLNDAPNRRFDDLDQQIYAPGDLGFSFVDTLPNLALFWPVGYNYGGVWPVDLLVTPQGADIAVGSTLQLEATFNYSDTSYRTEPSGAGSGATWTGSFASMNPKIATVNGANGLVTGISPGAALIIVRSPAGSGTAPSAERRGACTVIVHS
jgi:hypothetical protein